MLSWFRRGQPAANSSQHTPLPKPDATASVEESESLRRRGNTLLEQGHLRQAGDLYRSATALDPGNLGAWINLGFVLMEQQELLPAKAALEQAVRLDPCNDDALYMLGTVDLALGNLDEASGNLAKALQVRPDFEICRRDLCLLNVRRGAHEAARQLAESGIAIDPGAGELHQIVGNLYSQAGELAKAIESYKTALSVLPDAAHIHANLAKALQEKGEASEALVMYQRALQLDPTLVHALLGMGVLLQRSGDLPAAVQSYRSALERAPQHVEALSNLGAALTEQGKLAEARDTLTAAIRIDPLHEAGHLNLGIVLSHQASLGAAAASYRRALELNPDSASAHGNLGAILQEMGDHDAALASYGTAVILKPDYADARHNLLFTLNYHPDKSAQEIYSAYREYDERAGLPLRSHWRDHRNSRDRRRRLKVGYVSPDFRQHSVRHFLEPLLAHHDKGAVEVCAYAEVLKEDEVTSRYRTYVDQWIPTIGLRDEALAELIRSDGIDILVDLAGHTSKNRLGVFARRPAPVSISWLGFGYTTGLSAIDYFLTDSASVPEGSDDLFSEQPWRVTTPGYVYRPAEGMGGVNALPATARGVVTFGTLTRSVRVNHRCVRVWSQILHRVPGARLVVDSKNYLDAGMRAALLDKFAAHGIGPERLEIGFHSPPWDVLRGMDIGLDCFPHNSGTTLFETLYMGVPFVTLAGRPSVGRLGSSILEGVGHPEWIAHSEDEYIEKAVALASDLPRLAAMRAGLRSEMQASPLMDEPGFARKVEAAYREMFRIWATGHGGATCT